MEPILQVLSYGRRMEYLWKNLCATKMILQLTTSVCCNHTNTNSKNVSLFVIISLNIISPTSIDSQIFVYQIPFRTSFSSRPAQKTRLTASPQVPSPSYTRCLQCPCPPPHWSHSASRSKNRAFNNCLFQTTVTLDMAKVCEFPGHNAFSWASFLQRSNPAISQYFSPFWSTVLRDILHSYLVLVSVPSSGTLEVRRGDL